MTVFAGDRPVRFDDALTSYWGRRNSAILNSWRQSRISGATSSTLASPRFTVPGRSTVRSNPPSPSTRAEPDAISLSSASQAVQVTSLSQSGAGATSPAGPPVSVRSQPFRWHLLAGAVEPAIVEHQPGRAVGEVTALPAAPPAVGRQHRQVPLQPHSQHRLWEVGQWQRTAAVLPAHGRGGTERYRRTTPYTTVDAVLTGELARPWPGAR